MEVVSDEVAKKISIFVKEGLNLEEGRIEKRSDAFWKGLRDSGTEAWLDTGDIEAAASLWNENFTCLTTNNTLLNKEVQKGIYDELISEAGKILEGISDEKLKIREIAFILNARHGLRLVQKFGGKVSVELHTDCAHDIELTLHYARRFISICPDHFIVKIPLTPSGLIATRKLREEKVPINFTLGFSARHNYIASGFAFPSFVNVFLGRLNSYVADNQIGSGSMVGEKACIASQLGVHDVSKENSEPTVQIAASMRGAPQVKALAGIDVHTIPTAVADAARKNLDGVFEAALDVNVEVGVDEEKGKASRISTLWDITENERTFLKSLKEKLPQTAEELVEIAHASGSGDMFPKLSKEDMEVLESQGKIPKHAHWAERVAAEELAVDTLLNLAGLLSFTQDQAALDSRIKSLI